MRGSIVSSPAVVRCLLVRGLALVYAVAFISFWRQAHGLIGPDGILPAGQYLASAADHLGTLDAVRLLPTVLWAGTGDTALHVLCGSGTMAALLALL
ncbi:MAG: hypothetical protein HOH74_07205, partial [Gemmatimonadetes bacterium]|nr:hypothetical protein [Gemmatimonadota bacterium]